MAWPSTPLTSYVANTTPVIHASDLNSLQSGTNGIIRGTYSHRAVVIDGTGGSVVTPVPGTIELTTAASGSSWPTTQFDTTGLSYLEGFCCGFASEDYDSLGVLQGTPEYYNVKAVAYDAVNKYFTVTFGIHSTKSMVPVVTGRLNTDAAGMPPWGILTGLGHQSNDGSGCVQITFSLAAVVDTNADGNFDTVRPGKYGYSIALFGR